MTELSIEERLLAIENTLFHLDFADEEELSGEQALARSVNGLTATAATLASVLEVVQKNQAQLEGLEQTAEANVAAIHKSSTKVELQGEVTRLAKERRGDRFRFRWIVAMALFVSLSLIGNNFVQFTVFKNDRQALAVAYSKSVADACVQRNQTWVALEKFLETQRNQTTHDKTLSHEDMASRLDTYDRLLASIPVVDCAKLATGLAGGWLPQGQRGPDQMAVSLRS